MTTCVMCDETLTGNQRRFCSKRCKNRSTNSYEKQFGRGMPRRIALIEAKGCKCQVCGYDKNLAALVFHHRDPADKSFEVDMHSCGNRNMESLLLEAEKCDLLCHNCHAEIHYPHYLTENYI